MLGQTLYISNRTEGQDFKSGVRVPSLRALKGRGNPDTLKNMFCQIVMLID
jgi:hypothetical protein